jgi:DNA-directed RNA polymerase specialized sigma24 family protein
MASGSPPLSAVESPDGPPREAIRKGNRSGATGRVPGDSHSFDRHGDEIHRYVARRLGPGTAEDVVAEMFLTAFRKRGQYDFARPPAVTGLRSR